MNTATQTTRVEIQNAEMALRELLAGDFRRDAPEDAGSLDRMLIHLTNIQEAIETTPACRANAAKRLNDFSVTTARMATRNPTSRDALAKLTAALQTAGARALELVTASAENGQANGQAAAA